MGTEDDLSALTVVQLKEKLKGANLPTAGKKAETHENETLESYARKS